MAGYIELEVTKRDRENCDALHAAAQFVLEQVDGADLVATEVDDALSADVSWTLLIPDEHQFDRILDAYRAVSTTGEPPLVNATCYRSGRPNELELGDDEHSIEYFNPRPNSDGFMVHHTDSAVRLTHRPSRTVAISERARSRHANLRIARQMLSAKLADNPAALLLGRRSIESLKHRPFPAPTR